jgi:hypothetical protein
MPFQICSEIQKKVRCSQVSLSERCDVKINHKQTNEKVLICFKEKGHDRLDILYLVIRCFLLMIIPSSNPFLPLIVPCVVTFRVITVCLNSTPSVHSDTTHFTVVHFISYGRATLANAFLQIIYSCHRFKWEFLTNVSRTFLCTFQNDRTSGEHVYLELTLIR